MRRLIVLTPAFVLVAACGGSPIKQEGTSERSTGAAGDRSGSVGEDPAPLR